jgi:hypothetical protein
MTKGERAQRDISGNSPLCLTFWKGHMYAWLPFRKEYLPPKCSSQIGPHFVPNCRLGGRNSHVYTLRRLKARPYIYMVAVRLIFHISANLHKAEKDIPPFFFDLANLLTHSWSTTRTLVLFSSPIERSIHLFCHKKMIYGNRSSMWNNSIIQFPQ